MRELFLVFLDGISYGIWKDEIQSVRDIDAFHHIPLTPPRIAGVMMEEGHSVVLADLQVCIGLPPTRNLERGSILLAARGDERLGFVVSGELRSRPVPAEAVAPMPDYLRTILLDQCASVDGIAVPLINIHELYSWVIQPNAGAGALPQSLAIRADHPAATRFRLISIAGERYALTGAELEQQIVDPGEITPLPYRLPYLRGISSHNGQILTMIDMAQRIAGQSVPAEVQMLQAGIGDAVFGLLVERDEGTLDVAEVETRSLPMLARTPWMQQVVVHSGELIPLIDVARALSAPASLADEKPLRQRYAPDSQFPSQFFMQDVIIEEFSLLGVRHALPRDEMTEVTAYRPCRTIPGAPMIVMGVIEHHGEILPVLDLAMMFGRHSLCKPEWRMMLMRNGDFRAFVVTETIFGERKLEMDLHRAVPISLPHNLLYGCYPDEDAARLILNVAAIAVHFEKSLIKKFLPALSPEMRMSATGKLHAFHDDNLDAELRQSAAEESVHPQPPHETDMRSDDRPGIGISVQEPAKIQMSVPAPETEAVGEWMPQEERILTPSFDEAAVAHQAKLAEQKLAEQKLAEQKLAEQKLAEQRLAEEKQMAAATAGRTAHAATRMIPEEVSLAASTGQQSGDATSVRRRIAYAAIAAVLLGVLYVAVFMPSSEKTGNNQTSIAAISPAPKPRPDQAPPAPDVPAAQTSRAEQPVAPLELKIPAEKSVAIDVYVVQRGDTLWGISERFTDNPFNYPRIAGENRIANADLIFPGQRIRLIK